jgi:hypothetical protein
MLQPVFVFMRWRRADGSFELTVSEELLPDGGEAMLIRPTDEPSQHLGNVAKAIHSFLGTEQRFGDQATVRQYSVLFEHSPTSIEATPLPIGAKSWGEVERFTTRRCAYNAIQDPPQVSVDSQYVEGFKQELREALEKLFPGKDVLLGIPAPI